MSTWRAEIVVDEGLVRRLLGQFHLDATTLRPLSEGWDRSVWLVDDSLVFGFPRRAVVVPGVQREIELLPRLGPLLPLPIPQPVFIGAASNEYPWPFYGSAFLPGVELGVADVDPEKRLRVARDLALFLRCLHGDDVAAAIDAGRLPPDANHRADTRRRVALAREQLADAAHRGVWRVPEHVTGFLDRAAALPSSRDGWCVVHGDLHLRHVLVGARGVSGVIDWVDLGRSDPAIDLAVTWSSLDADERKVFFAAYGPVTEEQLVRARVVALSLCAALALYSHDQRLPRLLRAAVAGLDQACLT